MNVQTNKCLFEDTQIPDKLHPLQNLEQTVEKQLCCLEIFALRRSRLPGEPTVGSWDLGKTLGGNKQLYF